MGKCRGWSVMVVGLMAGAAGFQAAHLGYHLLAPRAADSRTGQIAARVFEILSSLFALGSGVGVLWTMNSHFALAGTLFNVGSMGTCFTLVGGVVTLILGLGYIRHLRNNAVQYLNGDTRIESGVDYAAECRKAIQEALDMQWGKTPPALKQALEGQLDGDLNPAGLAQLHDQLVRCHLQLGMQLELARRLQATALYVGTLFQNQPLQGRIDELQTEQEQLQSILEKTKEAVEHAASHARTQQIHMRWQEEPQRDKLQLDLIVGIVSGVILSLFSSYFWIPSTLLQVALLATTVGKERALSINHSVNVSNFDGEVSIDLLLNPVPQTAGKTCVICQEVLGRMVVQPCKEKEHVFHANCIGDWIAKQGKPFTAGIKKVVTVNESYTTFYISKEGEHMPSCPMCRSEMLLPATVQMVNSEGQERSASVEWVDKDWVYRPPRRDPLFDFNPLLLELNQGMLRRARFINPGLFPI